MGREGFEVTPKYFPSLHKWGVKFRVLYLVTVASVAAPIQLRHKLNSYSSHIACNS